METLCTCEPKMAPKKKSIKKLNHYKIHLHFDPVITFLGIYPQGNKNLYTQYMHTHTSYYDLSNLFKLLCSLLFRIAACDSFENSTWCSCRIRDLLEVLGSGRLGTIALCKMA